VTELVVRRLLIDLQPPIARHWNGGDPFRSAFFNALSMSFPRGEQYFIDSVRNGLKSLSEADRAAHATEVQGFIGQEATHRRIHALFNAHLEQQGHINRIEQRAQHRIEASAHLDLRNHLAATAATEHFTALFADWMLRHPEALEGAEPRLQTLWLWHSAEESEHRSTAFDIYRAAGGNQAWRVRVFRAVTVIFLVDLLRQTLRNLWHDGCLFQWRTWRSAQRLLFARDGLIRSNLGLWRDYLRADFHPSQHDATRSQQWLRDNREQFTVVGQTA
jgi:predicted metal-dependent hydrolase